LKTSQIFLVDENIPLSVIKQLRKEGCKIISVTEEFKGSSDEKILELSSRNKWIIITFDKDFGELIYKQRLNRPFGIILLRVAPKSAAYLLELLKWLILEKGISFDGNLVVMTADKIRTIKLEDLNV
jgi:predicted nuclease of predicted toxin-antitoxin system